MADEHQTPPPVKPSPPKVDGLEVVLAGIRKRIGDPRIIYNLHDKVEDFPALSSGIQCIDDALCGGIPEGRIVELYGPESSGKTTVMLHFIAAAQANGYIVYFIDAENALDLQYAMRIGVKPKDMLFSQPDYGEQSFEVMTAICESIIDYNANNPIRMKALIVLDSVAALVPKQEFNVYEKDGIDATVAMGSRARMLSSKLPMICNKASKAGVSVVFINQMRDKLGVTWGPTTTTPGGRALKFFASVRIHVTRTGLRKVGNDVVGIKSRLRPDKSKLYPIFDKEAEFFIGPNGIDQIAALVEECLRRDIVNKSGAWVKFGDKSFQGAVAFEREVAQDESFRASLEDALASARSGKEGLPQP